MCESFFATIEYELIDRHRFATKAEAQIAVFRFIEGFYNPSRRHSSIGYPSPDAFEAAHQPDRAQTPTPKTDACPGNRVNSNSSLHDQLKHRLGDGAEEIAIVLLLKQLGEAHGGLGNRGFLR